MVGITREAPRIICKNILTWFTDLPGLRALGGSLGVLWGILWDVEIFPSVFQLSTLSTQHVCVFNYKIWSWLLTIFGWYRHQIICTSTCIYHIVLLLIYSFCGCYSTSSRSHWSYVCVFCLFVLFYSFCDARNWSQGLTHAHKAPTSELYLQSSPKVFWANTHTWENLIES